MFKSIISESVKSQVFTNHHTSAEQFLLHLSKLSRKISNEHGRYFDTLVAIGGTLSKSESYLKYLPPSGEIVLVPVSRYFDLGSPHGTVFLKKLFHSESNMEQVAELGYFIIKYMQRFELGISILDVNPHSTSLLFGMYLTELQTS